MTFKQCSRACAEPCDEKRVRRNACAALQAYNSRVITSFLASELARFLSSATPEQRRDPMLNLTCKCLWSLHAFYGSVEAAGRYLTQQAWYEIWQGLCRANPSPQLWIPIARNIFAPSKVWVRSASTPNRPNTVMPGPAPNPESQKTQGPQ